MVSVSDNVQFDDVQFDDVPDLEDVPVPNDFLPHDFSKVSTPLKKYARGSTVDSTRPAFNVDSSYEEQSDNENNLSFNFSQCKNQSDIMQGILRDITNRSRNQESKDEEDLAEDVENSDLIQFHDEAGTDEESSKDDGPSNGDENDDSNPDSNEQETLSDEETSHPLASRSILERLEMSVGRIRAILNGTNHDNADGNTHANKTNSSCTLL